MISESPDAIIMKALSHRRPPPKERTAEDSQPAQRGGQAAGSPGSRYPLRRAALASTSAITLLVAYAASLGSFGGSSKGGEEARQLSEVSLSHSDPEVGNLVALTGLEDVSQNVPFSESVTIMDVMVGGQPSQVSFKTTGGFCTRSVGPFNVETMQQQEAAKNLGLWSDSRSHIVCFQETLHPDSKPNEAQFLAILNPRSEADEGKFGFGPGVSVNVRPDIETTAVWPLAAGVESLGIEVQPGQLMRALGLRTMKDQQVENDFPLVVVRRARITGWMLDLQFVDPVKGSCTAFYQRGLHRFVCHANPEQVGQKVELVAFCPSCAKGATTRVHITDRIMQVQNGTFPTFAHSDKDLASDATKPWLGWSAEVPGEGEVKEWSVSVETNGVAGGKGSVFEIFLISDTRHLIWMVAPSEKKLVHAAGHVLLYIAAVATGLAGFAAILAAYGFPVPLLGMQPSFAAATLLVQLLVLVGSREDAPIHLQQLCKPLTFLMPVEMARGVGHGAFILAAVMCAHCCGVLTYVVRNGRNSAAQLPHGLAFGSWELRALGFVATPLAAGSAQLILRGVHIFRGTQEADLTEQVTAGAGLLCGAVLLGSMVMMVYNISKQVHTLFSDDAVRKVDLPMASGTIFVDSVCDQQRALPVCPGRSKLFGEWLASPNWSFAPTVAGIYDVEYRGSLMTGEPGTWRALWSPTPWQLRIQERRGLERSSSLTRNSSFLANQGPGGQPVNTLEEMEKYRTKLSPTMSTHRIPTVAHFPYNCANPQCIAGVVGLPWVDVAVPAGMLRRLEESTEDGLEIGTHVGQLAGPVTGGRLGVCFDWGDSSPFRWLMDIFCRICLGVYLATCPMGFSDPMFTALHVGVVFALFGLIAATLHYKPYNHMVDNVTCCFALLGAAMLLVVPAVFDDDAMFQFSQPTLIFLVIVFIVPMVILALSALLTISFSCRWSQESTARVLLKVVNQWGRISPVRAPKGTKEQYTGLWWDGDCTMGVDSAADATQTVEVVLTPDVDKFWRIRDVLCPAELRMECVHLQIDTPVAPTGAVAKPAKVPTPVVPLPATLLFDAPLVENLEPKSAVPIAAVLTPQKGILVYRDAHNNNNQEWDAVVEAFFRGHSGNSGLAADHKGLVEATCKAIKSQESQRQGGRGSSEPVLTIVEVRPSR